MNDQEARKMFKKILGNLDDEDLEVLEANRKFQESASIINSIC